VRGAARTNTFRPRRRAAVEIVRSEVLSSVVQMR
jgi:hypothetical protein